MREVVKGGGGEVGIDFLPQSPKNTRIQQSYYPNNINEINNAW